MTDMTCPSCGAPFHSEAAFCSRCGAPRAAAPQASSAWSAVEPSGHDFTFTGGALGLFFRALGLAFGMFLIAPAPWLVCWFYEWFVGKVQGRYGSRLSFNGTPGSVWVLTTLYGLLFVSGIVWSVVTESNDEPNAGAEAAFQLVNNLGSVILGWFFFRWAIGHTTLDGRPLTLTAGLVKYVGWMVVMMLSIITIIGWAWVSCAMYRWLAGTVEGGPGRFRFTAKGHQLLGRTILYILFSVPIVTMPWAIRWYFAWFVEQFQLEDGSRQGPLSVVPA